MGRPFTHKLYHPNDSLFTATPPPSTLQEKFIFWRVHEGGHCIQATNGWVAKHCILTSTVVIFSFGSFGVRPMVVSSGS